MPTGRVKWYEPDAGEARIVAQSGGEYPASRHEIEPEARVANAHVTFKIRREDGVERAVDVRLREGTRVARAQHDFGDLSGASRPGADEAAPRVARRWVDALARGDRAAALRFYAPDCVIHTRSGSTEKGRKAAQASLDRNPLLGSGHLDVEIREVEPRVLIRWTLSEDDQARIPTSEQRTQTGLRIAHGQIVEQWD